MSLNIIQNITYHYIKVRRFFIVFLIITPFSIHADEKQIFLTERTDEQISPLYNSGKEKLALQGNTTLCSHSQEEDKGIDKTKGLYFIMGHYAYFPELNSEKPVYIVNEIGRGMVPGWKNLITFKDMRKIGLFGDIWAGIGLHCGKYLSFWSGMGGGIWKINNNNRYGPLKIRLDLTGEEFLLEAGMDYFPFGKTEYRPVKNETFLNRLKRTLFDTKPYLSLNINYSRFEASGDAKIGIFNFPIKYTRKKK
ncbi:MAG: hypothetical protein ACP5UA_03700 [Candidatus Hydrogenedens sp.]